MNERSNRGGFLFYSMLAWLMSESQVYPVLDKEITCQKCFVPFIILTILVYLISASVSVYSVYWLSLFRKVLDEAPPKHNFRYCYRQARMLLAKETDLMQIITRQLSNHSLANNWNLLILHVVLSALNWGVFSRLISTNCYSCNQ